MLQRDFPDHVLEITEDLPRRAAEVQFIFKLAAIYHNPKGSVGALAESCGYHPKALASMSNISPELAIKLEGVLGRKRFPRELFRPDLFQLPE